MTNEIKEKIQKIKLARMGPEYRFVAEMFSDLEVRYSVKKPGCIFYLINGEPYFQFVKDGKYLWCHYEKFWMPLMSLVQSRVYDDGSSYYNTKLVVKMREIISHYSLGYFDHSGITPSMASSDVTNSWKSLKLIKRKPWNYR